MSGSRRSSSQQNYQGIRSRLGLRRCRDERQSLPAERDAVRFPYAVLELKLSNGSCPLWVTALVAAGASPESPSSWNRLPSSGAYLLPLAFPNGVARPLIGSPSIFAGYLIGSPITSHNTNWVVPSNTILLPQSVNHAA